MKTYTKLDLEYRQEILDSLPIKLSNMIIDIVADGSRKSYIVEKRRAIITELKDNFKFSFPKIGLLLMCDHSTVISHYKKSKL